jgi:hypothetical protein
MREPKIFQVKHFHGWRAAQMYLSKAGEAMNRRFGQGTKSRDVYLFCGAVY